MIDQSRPGEICILAGGLSSRMGRDKSRLRLGGRTLLQHVRQIARQTGWPVRVIRRDLVARCGPLGGVYTGLKTTRKSAVLFLACDMPSITAALLARLIAAGAVHPAVFAHGPDGAGFPFLLHRSMLPEIERLLAARQYSLQGLACHGHARLIRTAARLLININTADDLAKFEF